MNTMIQFEFNCPHCRQLFLGEPAFSGRTFTCPVCKRSFAIPECPPRHLVVNPPKKQIVLNRPKRKIVLHPARRVAPASGEGRADEGGA